MIGLLRRLRARWKYRHFEHDLVEEIDTHRALAEAEARAAGENSTDARRLAARQLGNVALAREDARRVWIGRWVEEAWQDVRYALTCFRRQPRFALGVVAMLGLGLGLLTTVHSVADAMLWRPWQVPNGERIRLVRPGGTAGSDFGMVSIPEYRALRSSLQHVEGLALSQRSGSARLDDGSGLSAQVPSLNVSASYFDVLGVRMVHGRSFLPSEDDSTTPVPVAVIGEGLWRARFGADPALVGRTIRIGTTAHLVVGVAPEDFLDPHDSRTAIWRPFTMSLGRTPEQIRAYADPRHRGFSHAVLALLRRDSSAEQAQAELNAMSAQFRETAGLPARPYRFIDTRPSSNGFVVAVAAVVLASLGLVHLAVCANVGSLILARGLSRQREMAVRLSLGAGRGRLVRQIMTEVSALVFTATVVAVTTVVLAPRALAPWVPLTWQRAEFFGPTTSTLLLAAVTALITGLAAGLAPALRMTRVSLAAVAAERHGSARSSVRLRRLLLTTQVTTAVVLLSVAGVFGRAIAHAASADPGFKATAFTEVLFDLPRAVDLEARRAVYEAVQRVTQNGGGPATAFAEEPVLGSSSLAAPVRASSGSAVIVARRRDVSLNYFDVIQRPLVAGRMPRPGSGGYQAAEIVVNETLATRLWPDESPLGRDVFEGFDGRDSRPSTIVGVAPDLPTVQIDRIDPVVYRELEGVRFIALVRSRDRAAGLALERAAQTALPGVTTTARPLEETLGDTLGFLRTLAAVGWGIGAIGLTVAVIGLFAVFAHAVEERRREIGIRLALGASRAAVARLMLGSLRHSMSLGLATGFLLALGGAVLARRFLFGLSPLDPVGYLQAAAILVLAGVAATWVPVRRATRVDPVVALRVE